MKLSWKERGRTRVVDRLDDVVALPPSTRTTDVFETDSNDALKAASGGRAEKSDANAFIQAGWSFVTAERNAANDRRAVYIDDSGRMFIDGRRLIVRFVPDASKRRIASMLSQHGLVLERELTFGPNLFEVSTAGTTAKPGSDIVELADEVGNEPDVDFVSPSFIEVISGRSP